MVCTTADHIHLDINQSCCTHCFCKSPSSDWSGAKICASVGDAHTEIFFELCATIQQLMPSQEEVIQAVVALEYSTWDQFFILAENCVDEIFIPLIFDQAELIASDGFGCSGGDCHVATSESSVVCRKQATPVFFKCLR